MDKYRIQNLRISLPRHSSVKNVILKYSSPVSLNTGAKFRVCNICGKKLEYKLSEEHTQHLKTHTQSWKSYKKNVSLTLKTALKNASETPEAKNDSKEPLSESSSSDSEDFLDCRSVVHTLGLAVRNNPPPLTIFEKKELRKFTYDKYPIKELREFSDIRVMSMCNDVKVQQINEYIGQGPSLNLMDPSRLYVSKSETINKIARMLCENQCYFDPNACFFDDDHTFNFRDLMKKELHEKFNPTFENIINNQKEEGIVLEYDGLRPPNTYKLCEKIGFTTQLHYNKQGYLDMNYDVFCRQLWDHNTPLFVLEEKKILDVILALLIAASQIFETKLNSIANMYAQEEFGLNRPVLAAMNHGPDMHGFASRNYEQCNMEFDEEKANFHIHVDHRKCKNFTKEDYWKYKHKYDKETEESKEVIDFVNCGPASLLNQSVVYPCNMGHWHECECRSCSLLRNVNCKNHKLHMQHNIKKCMIKELTDCDEHYIDHPENVKDEDFVIESNVLFHNGKLLKSGRNYRNKRTIFAGIKRKCEKCRRKLQDHFRNHLVLHVHCDLCVHESKSSEILGFWETVCKICGKKFETQGKKENHIYKHQETEKQCGYCGKIFGSTYNYQRHLNEQHQVHQHANNGPFEDMKEDDDWKYVCTICEKEFRYERNVYTHMFDVHYKQSTCQCAVCGENFTKKANLKRHLEEQHDIINTDRHVPKEQLKDFICSICGSHFIRKSILIDHMKVHDEKRIKYECSHCQETFSSLTNLKRHEKGHTNELKGYTCHVCNAEFVRKWNLKQHLTTHETSKQEFQCKECGKTFEAKRTLTRHVALHH